MIKRGKAQSDIPFGSEFSPSQVNLPHLLELVHDHQGDPKALEDAILEAYFSSHAPDDANRRRLANNSKRGMVHYGLIDDRAQFTALGERLYSIRNDEKLLYDEFAKHILINLNGYALIQCVQDLTAAGERVTLVNLRKALLEKGLNVPRGGKHPSIMRLWLEKAGIFLKGWLIDQRRLEELLGRKVDELESLVGLTAQQRAYLRALASIDSEGPYLSNHVARHAQMLYGTQFNEKSLPKDVLYPLANAGFITLERGTKIPGRGAKPFLVRPTDKLERDLIIPLLDQLERQVGAEIRHLVRKPLSSILQELTSEDKHRKGLALEALAFKLMRLIDLDYVTTRLRGADTGGAEVDLVFESSRLMFSRWQVQCKNTKSVALEDVAKEVGLTHLLKSNVVMIVSTGEIGPETRRYANKVMKDTNLSIIMVDRADLQAIQRDPTAIVDICNREARHAMQLKSLDLEKG